MSFDMLKARRGNTNTAKLIEEINKIDPSSRKRVEDDRFWKPTTDKVGNGYAVLRFLPAREEEDLVVPFVSVYDHGFQGPSGKWYIENSLTTIGKDDPVSELNQKLWNSGLESDKETARKQKRRLHYITNVLVIKDPAAPQNEGQVKLYRIGAKIYTKIKDAMAAPAFEDEKQIIPFDFWEGANFKLKIRKVEGYTNYDTSSFDDPSALFDGDEKKIEEVYNKLYSLKQFIDPEGKDINGYPLFKPYADLKEKLYKVLELNIAPEIQREEKVAHRRVEEERLPTRDVAPKEDESPWTGDSSDDGEDDTLDYFRKLAGN